MKRIISSVISAALLLSAAHVFAEDDNKSINTDIPDLIVEAIPIGEEGLEDDTLQTEVTEPPAGDEQTAEDVPAEDAGEEESAGDLPTETETAAETPEPMYSTEQPTETESVEMADDAVPSELPFDEAELLSFTTPEGDKWSAAGTMTERRVDAELVIAQGELYAIGGLGYDGYLNTIEKYNDTSGTWQYVTDIPYDLRNFTAEAIGDTIYLIGGYWEVSCTNAVRTYNITSNSWGSAHAMTYNREGAVSAVLDDKIYVFGGRNGSGFVNSYEVYDTTEDTWNCYTSNVHQSLIRFGGEAEFVNGYLFMWGGIDKDYMYGGLDAYKDDLKHFETVVPAGNEDVNVVWGSDKGLLLIGDGNENAFSTVNEIYVSSDSGISLNDTSFVMEVPRGKRSRCIMYNGYLYSIGGYRVSSRSYMDNVYKYSVHYGDFSTGDISIDNAVTESGNTLTLNAQTGREYMLFINISDASAAAEYTFNIEFPYDSFTVEDAAAFTAESDISPGAVDGTDIELLDVSGGGISFICDEDTDVSNKAGKTVNVVILKANSSGERTITYSLTKN